MMNISKIFELTDEDKAKYDDKEKDAAEGELSLIHI